MESKRIVIALGGNALGNNLHEQMLAVKETAKAIADLIEEGHQVVISHGNGPQVGMIYLAMQEFKEHHPDTSVIPMSVCVGMSQGYIGYDIQNALREELLNRNIKKSITSLITQVVVDENDPAFNNPTKPIGKFMTKEEADKLLAEGYTVVEDSGRGWRRTVASPKPLDIVEIDAIKVLLDAGQIAVASGGGGIPVSKNGNHLAGKGAVIDKDFASAKMAELLDADYLIILTAVEKVCINFGKPNQETLDNLTLEKAQTYVDEGHFAPGSMLPKVQAGMLFASSKKGRRTLITLLEKARDGIAGKTGTVIEG